MYFIVTVNDNTNGNHRRIILNVKNTKLYVPVVALAAKDNQNYQNFLPKEFERSDYWSEYKTKSGNKITTNEYRYFIDSNFVGVNRLFLLLLLLLLLLFIQTHQMM